MTDLDPAARQALIDAAHQVRERAYAPYSKFFVGAALRTPDGRIFVGTNVENASYGLTICAERAAVFSAISAGERTFDALALITAGGYAPCGACRQVLTEFNPTLPILILDCDAPSQVEETTLDVLLPRSFRLDRG